MLFLFYFHRRTLYLFFKLQRASICKVRIIKWASFDPVTRNISQPMCVHTFLCIFFPFFYLFRVQSLWACYCRVFWRVLWTCARGARECNAHTTRGSFYFVLFCLKLSLTILIFFLLIVCGSRGLLHFFFVCMLTLPGGNCLSLFSNARV